MHIRNYFPLYHSNGWNAIAGSTPVFWVYRIDTEQPLPRASRVLLRPDVKKKTCEYGECSSTTLNWYSCLSSATGFVTITKYLPELVQCHGQSVLYVLREYKLRWRLLRLRVSCQPRLSGWRPSDSKSAIRTHLETFLHNCGIWKERCVYVRCIAGRDRM